MKEGIFPDMGTIQVMDVEEMDVFWLDDLTVS
jgi:hypothetical protein